MGTRGFIGFVIDGTEKIAYNHYDSYPDGLGEDVRAWLVGADLAVARDLARALRVVESGTEPTDEDIEGLAVFLDKNVGERRDRPDWYQLLRHTQGRPGVILEAGVLEDASSFPVDSLFAEWGYLVDFDANVFEAYKGFQRAHHNQGRFANRPGERDDRYRPVALVGSWPLDALPTAAAFIMQLEGEEG